MAVIRYSCIEPPYKGNMLSIYLYPSHVGQPTHEKLLNTFFSLTDGVTILNFIFNPGYVYLETFHYA